MTFMLIMQILIGSNMNFLEMNYERDKALNNINKYINGTGAAVERVSFGHTEKNLNIVNRSAFLPNGCHTKKKKK